MQYERTSLGANVRHGHTRVIQQAECVPAGSELVIDVLLDHMGV